MMYLIHTFSYFILQILIIGIFDLNLIAQPSNQEKVKNSIILSRDYIINHTRDDGQFIYEVNINPKVRITENYNVLRHCGTIYGLGMMQELKPSVKLKSTIEKSCLFTRKNFFGPIDHQPGMSAMWSTHFFEKHLTARQAKLGGAGLGIMALSSLYKATNDSLLLQDIKSLGEFILFMQKEDGSFYSKYISGNGGRNDEFNSLYYPGEAILGLIILYEFDKSDKWLDAAIRGISYLANLRRDQQEIPGDHWALIASDQLLKISKVLHEPELRELIIHHASQICRSMMEEQITDKDQQDVYGAYSYYGASTSASTALEGLISALQFLPKTTIIYKELLQSVEIGIDFLLKAQIIVGPYSGAFPYAVGSIYGKRKDVKKFALAKTSVRIDYVQHALSALIKYHQFKYPENS